ncbi:MAG: hypothetical protein Q9217_005271 [Psora testacea]
MPDNSICRQCYANAAPSSTKRCANKGGAPPDVPPPTSLSENVVKSFQAVNFLKNLESAFFEQALANLTKWNEQDPKHSLDDIIAVVTKSSSDVETAMNILEHFGKDTFAPCEYQFPVLNVKEFLQLADVITTVDISGVINDASGLALSDPKLKASTSSPTLHHSTPAFPPLMHSILPAHLWFPAPALRWPQITTISPLKAVTTEDVTGSSGHISFTHDPAKDTVDASKNLYIGWVNQANVVNYREAKVSSKGTLESTIPSGLAGIAFAPLTGKNTVPDVNALTTATLAGPAPVRIS